VNKRSLVLLVAIACFAALFWVWSGYAVGTGIDEKHHEVQGDANQASFLDASPTDEPHSLDRVPLEPPGLALPQSGELVLHRSGFEELPASSTWVFTQNTPGKESRQVALSAEMPSVDLQPGVWRLLKEPSGFNTSKLVQIFSGETTFAWTRSFQTYSFDVHDYHKTPIESAQLEWAPGPMLGGERVFEQTNGSGVATMNLPASLGTLKISHPDFWAETLTLREGVGGHFSISLVSLSPKIWAVQFVEVGSVEPISGLALSVVDAPGQDGQSDDFGRFTFTPPSEGGVTLRVRGDQNVSLEIRVDSSDAVLELPKSAPLSIQVFNGLGKAIEGAHVEVRCREPRDFSGPNGGKFLPESGESGLSGNALLNVPSEIPLEIAVRAEGYFSRLSQTTVPVEGAILSIRLDESQPLSLTILDSKGVPIRDAHVVGRSLDGSLSIATREDNGIYSFPSASGLVTIRIEGHGLVGLVGGRRQGKLRNEVGLGGHLVLRLIEGYAVHGKALWDSGKPATNVEISLMESLLSERDTTVVQAEGDAPGWRWTCTPAKSQVYTDSKGEFNFAGIEPGDWTINWRTPDGRYAVVALKYASFDLESITVPSTKPVTVVLPEPIFVVISATDQENGSPVSSFNLMSSHPHYIPRLSSENPVQAGLLRGWFQRRDLEYLTVVAPGYFPVPLTSSLAQQAKERELHYLVPLIPARSIEFQVSLPKDRYEDGISLTIQAYPSSGNGMGVVDERFRKTFPISGPQSLFEFDLPVGAAGLRLQLEANSPKSDWQVLDSEIWVDSSDSVKVEIAHISKE
jgi:hypothetical protein